MKRSFNLLVVLLLIVTVTSCKKECPAPPAPPVDLGGTTWKGSAVVNTITYNPFTIILNADGTASVQFQGFSAFPGSWSKTPNSTTVNLFFNESATNTWKGSGTLNAGNNKLESGTLTRTAPSVFNGTFTADKQ
jgi:hypothetical protein